MPPFSEIWACYVGIIAVLKNYCAKKDIRNDVLHQVDLVANAIPGVEELTCITQKIFENCYTEGGKMPPLLICA